MRLKTAVAHVNHERLCTGGQTRERQRDCGGVSLGLVCRRDYARHKRKWGAVQGVGKGRLGSGRVETRQCDRWQPATNIASEGAGHLTGVIDRK